MSVDLEIVEVLGADAVGEPGQRRFRIFAQSQLGSIVLWLEKMQLNDLSLALDRALAVLTEGKILRIEASASGMPGPASMPSDFPRYPTYEFQAGQIKVNYDSIEELFSLQAVPFDVVAEPDQEPQLVLHEDDAVQFFFTQQQAQNLSINISAAVSSGRPVCPLCRTPLDGSPHACVQQNGHREILLALQGEDDEQEEDE